MTILILVTHLLGIGHFARMRVLARGLVAQGHKVTLISGGRPQPHLDSEGFELVQLPPVHCVGSDFSTLYESENRVLSAETRAARIRIIEASFDRVAPEIVITETFPFGRRALKHEFLALCARAAARRPRPVIVASIRDILNPPSTPAKAQEAERLVDRYYDAVLVHGDDTLVPPQAGWPFGRAGSRALRITGYIDEGQTRVEHIPPHGAILVSGGGSDASLPLYRATLDAARLLPQLKWHVLIGHGVAAHDFSRLVSVAPNNVVMERARKDFRTLLAGARLSLSQAGYNTIVDLLSTQRPMVLVPFAAGQEKEQTLRAQALQTAQRATVVQETELSGETLAAAVTQALNLPSSDQTPINLGGIKGSITALEQAHNDRSLIETAWTRFEALLRQWRARGTKLQIWWRDDDAIEPTPELTRLLALSRAHGAPVSLAVIPARVSPALVSASGDAEILIHGIAHHNHAPDGSKKQELGFQPVEPMLHALANARGALSALFGHRARPVLAPPWNRIDDALVPRLAEAGIGGLSTFKRRSAPFAAAGVLQANTHFDPIDWRAGGGLAPEAKLVCQLISLVEEMADDPSEPLGLLTHHLVHDEAIWGFLDRLLSLLAASEAVQFVSASAVFDPHQMVPPAAMVE